MGFHISEKLESYIYIFVYIYWWFRFYSHIYIWIEVKWCNLIRILTLRTQVYAYQFCVLITIENIKYHYTFPICLLRFCQRVFCSLCGYFPLFLVCVCVYVAVCLEWSRHRWWKRTCSSYRLLWNSRTAVTRIMLIMVILAKTPAMKCKNIDNTFAQAMKMVNNSISFQICS